MTFTPYTLNPEFDLELVREVPIAPELVWRAWTEPELMKQWFTPKPWETTNAEVELRPGGTFLIEMRGPEGQEGGGGAGLRAGGHPRRAPCLDGRARPRLPPAAQRDAVHRNPGADPQRQRRHALPRDRDHGKAEHAKQHAEMGFEHGWGAALDQLVELMS